MPKFKVFSENGSKREKAQLTHLRLVRDEDCVDLVLTDEYGNDPVLILSIEDDGTLYRYGINNEDAAGVFQLNSTNEICLHDEEAEA